VQHDTAAFDDVTVVAQGHGRVRVLLDQQNGQPLLTVDGRDGREQLFGDIRRQSDRRLVRSFGRATRALPTKSICISPLAATRAIGVMSQARRRQGHRHIMLAGHEPFHYGRVPLHLLI
jgi:hypothetical protein